MKCAGCDDVNAAKYVARKRRGQYYCKDDVGTCERALCECDIQFAKTSGASEYIQNNTIRIENRTIKKIILSR